MSESPGEVKELQRYVQCGSFYIHYRTLLLCITVTCLVLLAIILAIALPLVYAKNNNNGSPGPSGPCYPLWELNTVEVDLLDNPVLYVSGWGFTLEEIQSVRITLEDTGENITTNDFEVLNISYMIINLPNDTFATLPEAIEVIYNTDCIVYAKKGDPIDGTLSNYITQNMGNTGRNTIVGTTKSASSTAASTSSAATTGGAVTSDVATTSGSTSGELTTGIATTSGSASGTSDTVSATTGSTSGVVSSTDSGTVSTTGTSASVSSTGTSGSASTSAAASSTGTTPTSTSGAVSTSSVASTTTGTSAAASSTGTTSSVASSTGTTSTSGAVSTSGTTSAASTTIKTTTGTSAASSTGTSGSASTSAAASSTGTTGTVSTSGSTSAAASTTTGTSAAASTTGTTSSVVSSTGTTSTSGTVSTSGSTSAAASSTTGTSAAASTSSGTTSSVASTSGSASTTSVVSSTGTTSVSTTGAPVPLPPAQTVFVYNVYPSLIDTSKPNTIILSTYGLTVPSKFIFRNTVTGANTSFPFKMVGTSVNTLQMIVNSSLYPGVYDIITENAGLISILSQALSVAQAPTVTSTDTPTIITSVTPTVVQQGSTFTIYGSGFVEKPSIFVNTGGISTYIPTVEFFEATLTQSQAVAVTLPISIAYGIYDLIAVFPGTLHALKVPAGINVKPGLPPYIDFVAPTFLGTTPQTIFIRGSGFSGVSATFFCTTGGAIFTDTLVGTVISQTSTNVSVSVTRGLNNANFSVCTMRLSNSDGFFSEFHGITTKQPDQTKLGTLKTGPSMKYQRYGHTVISGTPLRQTTPTAISTITPTITTPSTTLSFLYAIGNGAATSSAPNLEFASISQYGILGNWQTADTDFPDKIVYHGAVSIENAIYIVGGSLVSSSSTISNLLPTNRVYRAEVLDPREIPDLQSITVGLDSAKFLLQSGGGTFAPGTYYYRISSLYSSTDVRNPSGESLPSRPAAFVVPLGTRGIVPTINWVLDPRAVGYKIYRSVNPVVAGVTTTYQLLTQVAGTVSSYTDNYNSFTSTAQPKAIGSLGSWKIVATLNVGRISAGVVVSPQYQKTSSTASDLVPYKFWIHVLGGKLTMSATAETSYEFASVTVNSDRTQTVSTFTLVTAALNSRSFGSTLVINPYEKPFDITTWPTSLTPWIIYGCGEKSSGTILSTIDRVNIGVDGKLNTYTITSAKCSASISGFCGVYAAGTITYTGGGKSYAYKTIASSSLRVDTSRLQTAVVQPTPLTSISNQVASFARNLRFQGCTSERGNHYFTGGTLSDSTLSNEVYSAVQ